MYTQRWWNRVCRFSISFWDDDPHLTDTFSKVWVTWDAWKTQILLVGPVSYACHMQGLTHVPTLRIPYHHHLWMVGWNLLTPEKHMVSDPKKLWVHGAVGAEVRQRGWWQGKLPASEARCLQGGNGRIWNWWSSMIIINLWLSFVETDIYIYMNCHYPNQFHYMRLGSLYSFWSEHAGHP